MINKGTWNRLNAGSAVFLQPLVHKGPQIRDHDGEESASDSGCDDTDLEVCNGGIPLDGHFIQKDSAVDRPALTTERKMICTALLRGYSLTTKMWLNFFIGSTTEIAWNEGAFNRLVLPPLQKELILGFTESQNCYKDNEDAFDDVIEGKGKGMILLLCGPPGVGKTLTTESVAEEMKVPWPQVILDSIRAQLRLLYEMERNITPGRSRCLP
ncbi:P-loop containing nucleoside triphosphate hydrolase protein [Venturia nashicola]|uniref:P-loop containing nucleoside triphosphate hydrolase protein n=1 Tax=Venturia nashicola TaxID=86259 RepID=A0A4Z1NXF6_9PEZI|nr:P-loop containing nucleoside triphosphate hydrolase protein [Venturia nashicola]